MIDLLLVLLVLSLVAMVMALIAGGPAFLLLLILSNF